MTPLAISRPAGIDGRPAECCEDYSEVMWQLGLLPMSRRTGSNYGQLSRVVLLVAGNNCSADGLLSIRIGGGESKRVFERIAICEF